MNINFFLTQSKYFKYNEEIPALFEIVLLFYYINIHKTFHKLCALRLDKDSENNTKKFSLANVKDDEYQMTEIPWIWNYIL